MWSVLRPAAALLAAAFLLSACSTTDFKQPIADFSKATTDAAASFESYANSLDKTARDQNVEDVAQGRASLNFSTCGIGEKCETTVVRARFGALKLKPALLTNTRKLMASVVTYTKNLDAIASPEDIAAIKTAGEAIPGAIANAAKAADALNAQLGNRTNLASRVGIFTPVADIVVIGLTKYAEAEKLKALRNATDMMEAIFPQITMLLAKVAETDFGIKRAALFQKVNRTRTDIQRAIQKDREETEINDKEIEKEKKRTPDPDPEKEKKAKEAFESKQAAFRTKKSALQKATKDALDAHDTANEAYNTAITAKPASVFTKLGETHTALADALAMPKPNFQAVFSLIQQLTETATALAKDAKAIDDALQAKTKS